MRTFARELQIKIPWTQLATKPVEVLLDTVECVFKEGMPGGTGAVPTSSSSDEDDSDEEDLASPGHLLKRKQCEVLDTKTLQSVEFKVFRRVLLWVIVLYGAFQQQRR